jgi:hypothetical protein
MNINNELLDKNKSREPKVFEAIRSRLIEQKVRRKYTIEEEIGIMRNQKIKPEKYQEWFDYVEQCIAEADAEL